jgi:hypothetical protein
MTFSFQFIFRLVNFLQKHFYVFILAEFFEKLIAYHTYFIVGFD